MANKEAPRMKIPLADLRVGHFVDVERSWMNHPFLFSRFQISSQREIAILRGLGLTEITIYPDRSILSASNVDAAPAASADATAAAAATPEQMWEQKQDLMKRASSFREERQHLRQSL